MLWKLVPLLSRGEQDMEQAYHVRSPSGSTVKPWPGNEKYVRH